ncbi:MAG: biotin/lipoyl-binding protein [Betaproteobacteria bacterium]|nr:biotin/lipoyl-binding protein [Betaproteobacteria bacterium]
MRRYTLQIGDREFVVDVQETAVDGFDVVVGGETYAVTLAGDEDLPEAAVGPAVGGPEAAGKGAAAPAVRVARKAPVPAAAVAPLLRAATGAPAGAALNAPMPGVIVDVAVKAGDTVARGQLVAVLDAMKMHNNIKSPRAGTIAEVCVTPGHAVGHGDAIVRFREE